MGGWSEGWGGLSFGRTKCQSQRKSHCTVIGVHITWVTLLIGRLDGIGSAVSTFQSRVWDWEPTVS